MNVYTVGTQIEITAVYVDADGVPIDPITVSGEIREPNQTVSPLTFTRRDTGIYTVTFIPTKSGLHQYRTEGTGFAEAADESQFMAKTEFPS